MATVRIPPVLRTQAGNNKSVEAEGETVGDVLQGLISRYPDLREQLFAEEGALNRFVNVYLNDQDIRYLEELKTPVDARDTVVILPAMAGGAG
jgi:molybdopterin synthase sulfur carrier subunit